VKCTGNLVLLDSILLLDPCLSRQTEIQFIGENIDFGSTGFRRQLREILVTLHTRPLL
jgi:hypothetical protein